MPIGTPVGNLDIANATLRTSNLETQNIKIGSIFVGTGNSLEETANVGNSMSNTIQFTNTHTAFTTTGNVTVGKELTVTGNVTAPFMTGLGYLSTKTHTFDPTDNTSKYFLGWTQEEGMEIEIQDNGYNHGGLNRFYITFHWGGMPILSSADISELKKYNFYYTYKFDRLYLWFNETLATDPNFPNVTYTIRMKTLKNPINLTEPGASEQYISTTIGVSAALILSRISIANIGSQVGVGTTTPKNSLHVYKAAAEGTSGLFIEKASGGAGTTAALFFGVAATSETNYNGIPKAAIFYERNLVNGRGDIKFCNDEVNDANAVTTEAADTRMIIKNDGKVGIGTVSPSSTLHVAGGRVNIERFDDTTSIFTGLLGPNTDGGRSQLVLSSAYSDLVIASSRVNQNHGSTISFVTYDPSNVSDYRKFVINQGNWGARKEFLDFGLSSGTLDANPHLAINGTDTVLTLDGTNKRVGIGKDVPATKLDVGGRIYGSGTVVQVRDRYMQSSWTTTSGSSNGDIPQSLETDVKWNITPTKTSSRILVNFKFIAYFASMNGSSNGPRCQIWRKIGSTYSRVYGISGSYHDLHYYSVIQNHHAYIPISFVDSPGTTSVVEYALRARMYSQVGTMYIGNGGHQPVTIQLMEIGG